MVADVSHVHADVNAYSDDVIYDVGDRERRRAFTVIDDCCKLQNDVSEMKIREKLTHSHLPEVCPHSDTPLSTTIAIHHSFHVKA